MSNKQYLINAINERLQAVSQAEAAIEEHNRRFIKEVGSLITLIEQELQDVPAVKVIRDPLLASNPGAFSKLRISLFEKSVDLTSVEREGKLALQLEGPGYKAGIFQLDAHGRWVSQQQDKSQLVLSVDLIHKRLARIVELENLGTTKNPWT